MAEKKDILAYKPLFQQIFSEDLQFCDRIFSHRLDLVFDKRDNGTIASFLFAIPFTARILGKEYSSVYVYGVATVPEARGKGYMKEIFRKMESHFGSQVDFYYLVPANETLFSMYEKLGYQTAFYLKKEMLFPEKNPTLEYEIKEASEVFHTDYLSWTNAFDTVILRNEEDSDFYLSQGKYYKIKNSGFYVESSDSDLTTAYIREAYFSTENTKACLLDFLAKKGFTKVILTTPEPKTPYAMVKIVNSSLKMADFKNGYTNLNFD
ncbi:MAG: GNAT family N-acetyltransferase [Clostridia bacterium]|nr:GNAT family N-acetyltransferase [Clostridia bacterium]